MEPTPRYPLAPIAFGDGMRVSVGSVMHATLHENLGAAGGDGRTSLTTVELEPHPISGGWRVRWPQAHGSVIGEISAADRDELYSVDVVHDTGFIPTATARLNVNPSSGVCEVAVDLAPADFVIPRNNPLPSSVVLPGGYRETVDVDLSKGEFSDSDATEMSPGQWLVGLLVRGEDIVVTCDGRALGTINHPEADLLCSLIDASSAPVMARAFAIDGRIGVDAAPGSGASSLMRLPELPLDPETSDEAWPDDTWQVYEYSDGTLAITVALDAAIDPEDQLIPHPDARAVFLDWAPQYQPPAQESAAAAEAAPRVQAKPVFEDEPEPLAPPEPVFETETEPEPAFEPEPADEPAPAPEAKPGRPELVFKLQPVPEPEKAVEPEPPVREEPLFPAEPPAKPEPVSKTEPADEPEPDSETEPAVPSEPRAEDTPLFSAEPPAKPKHRSEDKPLFPVEPRVRPERQSRPERQLQTDRRSRTEMPTQSFPAPVFFNPDRSSTSADLASGNTYLSEVERVRLRRASRSRRQAEGAGRHRRPEEPNSVGRHRKPD